MRCKHCGITLISFDEEDEGICCDCIEIEIERSIQAQDWRRFHDEACPEIELTPRRLMGEPKP